MIRLTLTTPPRLHTISLEPGESGTLELDAAALLANGEVLSGVTVDDAGTGAIVSPVLGGSLCTVQIVAQATNSIILGEIFLAGDAGTIIRTSLRLRSIDPLNAAAPVVLRAETLKWRDDYQPDGVYIGNDIVRSGGSLWRAKRAVTGVEPATGDDWEILIAGAGATGLPGNIEAALIGATSPSAGNVFATVAEVTAEASARNVAISAAIDALLSGAPGALDTLNELAAALGDDADFAASVTTALAGKEPTLSTMSQAEAENSASTAKRATTGQRIWQAITAALALLKTIVGQYDNITTLTPTNGSTITVDFSGSNTVRVDATALTVGQTFSFAVSNLPASGKAIVIRLKVCTGAGIPVPSWSAFGIPNGVLALEVFQTIAAGDIADFANAEAHRTAMTQSATPEAYDYSSGWRNVYVTP